MLAKDILEVLKALPEATIITVLPMYCDDDLIATPSKHTVILKGEAVEIRGEDIADVCDDNGNALTDLIVLHYE